MRTLAGCTLLFFLQSGAAPVRSIHHGGPHGLVGWTEKFLAPDVDEGPLPFTLKIARRSHVIRTIQGGSFVWAWMFQDDGRHIATESGPLHFTLACLLYDTASGKRLASYDCFHNPLPSSAPAWVTDLEKHAFRFPD